MDMLVSGRVVVHLLYIKPPCHLGAQPSWFNCRGVTISGPPGTMKLKPMRVLGNEANTCMVIIGIHEPFLPYFSGQPVKPCLKCQVSGFHWISFSVGDLNKIQLLEDLDGKFWTLDPFLPYWDLRPLTVTSYVFGSNKLTNPPPKKRW